jgi:hypothetical protein
MLGIFDTQQFKANLEKSYPVSCEVKIIISKLYRKTDAERALY